MSGTWGEEPDGSVLLDAVISFPIKLFVYLREISALILCTTAESIAPPAALHIH
jgi:hypothetical protein